MTIYQIFPEIVHHPVFARANPQNVNRILVSDSFWVSEFQADESVYSSSDEECKVGIVLDGQVLIRTSLSEQTLLNTAGSGEIFGIANLYVQNEPFPTVIQAAQPCKILFFRHDAFRNLIEQDSEILRNFLTLQSQKILYLNRKIATFTAGNAEKKLALFILDHTENQSFVPPCSMGQLAAMLGIGRASLYRALDRFIEYGWLEKHQHQFLICDKKSFLDFLS